MRRPAASRARGPGLVVLFLVLLLASGACGKGPAPPGPDGAEAPSGGEGEPWFVEEAALRGLVFQHVSGHAERHLMPEIMGGGAALLDADGDGDLEAYLVQGGSLAAPRGERPPNRLFENEGGGRFRDVTEASGAGDRGYGMGVAAGDVDEDGDVDLYVTNVDGNALLVNDGDGAFADRSRASGTDWPGWSTSAAFLDADRDGDLDLYVVNYLDWTLEGELPCRNNLSLPDYCSPKIYGLPTRDLFFRNGGDGTFADESEASGVGGSFGTGLGVGVADFDGDGALDLFVANDGMPDFLWRNAGAGRFEEVGELAGCAVDADGVHKAGMGVAIGDVDGDDDPDLLVCNLNRESDSFYVNEGGYFVDRTARGGLALSSKPFTRFGLGWHDFDQDGLLDLFQANGRVNRQASALGPDPYAEPNLVFRGAAGGSFVEVLPRGGTKPLLVATSRAAAFGDVDDDGDLDVLVVNRDGPAHLLLGRAAGGRASLLLRVVEEGGRDAYGAAVRVRVQGRWIRRDVRADSSYLAANDPRVHFGLGAARGVEEIVVTWVDGLRERFGGRPAGLHRLARGTGEPADGEGGG